MCFEAISKKGDFMKKLSLILFLSLFMIHCGDKPSSTTKIASTHSVEDSQAGVMSLDSLGGKYSASYEGVDYELWLVDNRTFRWPDESFLDSFVGEFFQSVFFIPKSDVNNFQQILQEVQNIEDFCRIMSENEQQGSKWLSGILNHDYFGIYFYKPDSVGEDLSKWKLTEEGGDKAKSKEQRWVITEESGEDFAEKLKERAVTIEEDSDKTENKDFSVTATAKENFKKAGDIESLEFRKGQLLKVNFSKGGHIEMKKLSSPLHDSVQSLVGIFSEVMRSLTLETNFCQ